MLTDEVAAMLDEVWNAFDAGLVMECTDKGKDIYEPEREKIEHILMNHSKEVLAVELSRMLYYGRIKSDLVDVFLSGLGELEKEWTSSSTNPARLEVLKAIFNELYRIPPIYDSIAQNMRDHLMGMKKQ